VDTAMKGHVIAPGELVGRYTQEANNCNGGRR
jgi:hypothetical protein